MESGTRSKHPLEAACGGCGAAIPVPPAGGFVRCGFCSASLWVESRGTVRHLVYRPAIRSSEVGAAVNRWLFEEGAPPADEVIPGRLVYYPFWRVASGSRVDLHPAAASPEGPLDAIARPAGELVPYDPSLEEGAEVVSAAAPPPRDSDPWLVHVPVHHAAFSTAGRSVTVLVEATAGRVIAASPPPGSLATSRGRDRWILWGAAAALVVSGALAPWAWASAAWAAIGIAVLLVLGSHGGRP